MVANQRAREYIKTMAMTKKHFEAAARIVRDMPGDYTPSEITAVKWQFANFFREFEPSFNQGRFLEACEPIVPPRPKACCFCQIRNGMTAIDVVEFADGRRAHRDCTRKDAAWRGK